MKRWICGVLNLLATVQVVWFYVNRVPCYLKLPLYERGMERMPFQGRILMALPLRWAHESAWLTALAERLTGMKGWFPAGGWAEGIVEAVVGVASVVVAGWVARSIYKAASGKGLFTGLVYPLCLVMVVVTYGWQTMHWMRFVYDLPSLGFFAVGVWLIYFRRSLWWFSLVFVVGTVNRETTLFLLVMLLIREGLSGWRRVAPAVGLLTVYWVGWHVWVTRHFAGNAAENGPRMWLNIGLLMWPLAWAQMLSAGAFCLPLVVGYRNRIKDLVVRRWVWVLPVWFVFMMKFGILLEVRIFGELIPYLAVAMCLILESVVMEKCGQGVDKRVATVERGMGVSGRG